MRGAVGHWILCLVFWTPGLATVAAPPDPPMAGMAMTAGVPAGPPETLETWAADARLFSGLARTHRAVTTTSPEAQAFFDQGMAFMWGFNHDEATRSFARAAQIDPHCAACLWGLSLTVGPNYNLPTMTAVRAKVAFAALRRAQAEAAHASPVEAALISALARRYPDDRPLDPATLSPALEAYAAAMKDVAARFPDDLDVQTLYAESLMNLHAWKLWGPDGAPAPGTLEIVAVLKGVLARDINHPGANHYLVHALEASPHPEDAIPAAERLRDMAPAEGHMVHMPAHIFQLVGRYEDAAEANRKGIAADLAYVRETHAPDYYPAAYGSHNYQFLAYSAAMEGRRAEAIDAADHSRASATDDMLAMMPGMDWYAAEYYAARVRFGLWDALLAMTPPDPKFPGLTLGYLWSRGAAQAARGQAKSARASLATLEGVVAALPPDAAGGQNALSDIAAVAHADLAARIARVEARSDDEIRFLRSAVAAEDHLAYDEPRNWFAPTRQSLGDALMRAGRPAEAEATYRDDLRRNPLNGWSLFGLAQALEAQGRKAEAAVARDAFKRAWAHADVSLTASAF